MARAQSGRTIMTCLLIGVGAWGCYSLGDHWLPAILWIGGHLLIWWTIGRIDSAPSAPPTLSNGVLAGLLAGSSLVFLLGVAHYFSSPTFGWRGFFYLNDLPFQVWGHVLGLIPLTIGCWLFSLHQIRRLQLKCPQRRQRFAILFGVSCLLASTSILPFFEISFLLLLFSLVIYLFSIDLYLEDKRTSMTWLLVWLLMISLIIATFTYQRSLQIDQQAHQQIALDIARAGIPDPGRKYHLEFQWDTISTFTAPAHLSTDFIELEPGSGRLRKANERNDWVYHRADGQGYVVVGRPSNNFRASFAITSVFFLLALVYSLLLRGACGLLGFPYQHWRVPLFGPNSMKIRIQISFFVLTFLAMGLVSVFTVLSIHWEPELLNIWLEKLMTIYMFLLLIVGTLGIFFANSISDPIIRISEKIGDTQLQNNVPLTWAREDEIGKLVASYNQMIVALDESAAQLAASEREGAWREMAKQVAHEIKNPLTPMKLQLQQLLRLEKDDSERAREWSQRISRSIIEQIDGLALIATEFSNFARLPEAKATTFDLRTLAQSAYELHSAGKPEGQLRISLPEYATLIRADRDQLLRVLNNLLRNADQALYQQEQPLITIVLVAQDDQYVLSVTDNGPGIAPAIQAKIFQPSFTTKSSGMGLGLAMCKAIVEQAGGSISFQTNKGTGTRFEVNLPAAKPVNQA